jgi:hypothetical protein
MYRPSTLRCACNAIWEVALCSAPNVCTFRGHRSSLVLTVQAASGYSNIHLYASGCALVVNPLMPRGNCVPFTLPVSDDVFCICMWVSPDSQRSQRLFP